MPPLMNPKRELYAQEIVRGSTQQDAYEIAGFSRHQGNASIMGNRPDVKARVKELEAQKANIEERAVAIAAKKLSISKERVLKEFARVAFSDISDVIEFSGNEIMLKDMGRMSKRTLAAISEVAVNASGSIKVKMHPKLDALDKLARYLGLYKPEGTGNNTVINNIDVDINDVGNAREIFLGRIAGIAARLNAGRSADVHDGSASRAAPVGLEVLGKALPAPTERS